MGGFELTYRVNVLRRLQLILRLTLQMERQQKCEAHLIHLTYGTEFYQRPEARFDKPVVAAARQDRLSQEEDHYKQPSQRSKNQKQMNGETCYYLYRFVLPYSFMRCGSNTH